MPMLRHVVLFRLYDGTTQAQVEEALRALRALGDLPGVADWHVGLSTDDRKGTVIGQVGVFESEQVFRAFRESEAHAKAVSVMATRSDWLVADLPMDADS